MIGDRGKLVFLQVLAHVSIPIMLFLGSPRDYLASFCVYFLTGCLGMSMTYHRLLSHRSWISPRWFELLGTFCATLGATGSSLNWCAVHRSHHIHSDTALDPHSPHSLGFFRAHFLSLNYQPNLWIVRDLAKAPIHRFFHRYYFHIHGAYALFLLSVNPFLVVSHYLFPAAILWNAGSAINSFGHLFGYKNFPLRDHSRNNLVLGYLVWGEGWHNNHHRYPKKWSNRIKWFEFDMSAALIRFIRCPARPDHHNS